MKSKNNKTLPPALALATLALNLSVIQPARAASWITNSPLTGARCAHTATLLPNGKVLVVAGSTNGAAYSSTLSNAELYDPATGRWTVTGALSTAREDHTATLLPNGKVLVAGGSHVNSDSFLSSAEVYDPATGTWTATGALNTPRSIHTATLLPNGKVLVAGGWNGNAALSSAEVYDPATGTWTVTSGLANPRVYHTATLLSSGKVLVAGGYSGTAILSSAELYDPASGTWTTTGVLTTARANHTATLLPNGKVLVAGAFVNGVYLASAELYDPATRKWTATGALTTGRENDTATLLPNGKVLVAGGWNYNAGGALSSAELYDPVTGMWTASGMLTTAREKHTATLLPNGKALLAGGWSGRAALSSVELYDPAMNPSTGTWTTTGALTTAREHNTATLLPNGRVLVGGGEYWDGSKYIVLSSAELYDAATGRWTATGPLATARLGHTATLLPNGLVLVAGGRGSAPDNSFLSSSELYDPVTGTWTNTGALSTARSQYTATLLPNGKVLVTGGIGISSSELYDPATGTWTATGLMTTARFDHTATLLPNGKVLIAGGVDPNFFALSSAELYDPATGTWVATGSLATARAEHTATFLPNGMVLVAGGYGDSLLSSVELYDPASGMWTATGPLTTARFDHTATLMGNGKVLVTGGEYWDGVNDSFFASAELYDPAAGTWTATGPLTTARAIHMATFLPNGKVLAAGGKNSTSAGLSSAELFDIGLGFTATWQPQIATFTSPVALGGSLTLTGSRFRGVSGGSSGSTPDSPADYPVVQLRSLASEQSAFLPSARWTTNSFTSAPVSGFPCGWTLATVFVNGIPSTSSILSIAKATPAVKLGASLLPSRDMQLTIDGPSGRTYTLLISTNLIHWENLSVFTNVTLTPFTYSESPTNLGKRFYRVQVGP